MACTYRRGNRFWASYYIGKRQIRKSLGTDNERVARSKLKRLEYELALGDLHVASRSSRPLSAPTLQLSQTGQGLPLAYVAKSCDRRELLPTRPGCLLLPAIDGLACHADELAIVRRGEPQTLSLRAQALGGESHMVCIGFGSLGRSVLEHLFFERGDPALKVRDPAFHLGNVLAVLGRRLPENACLSADLLAGKT